MSARRVLPALALGLLGCPSPPGDSHKPGDSPAATETGAPDSAETGESGVDSQDTDTAVDSGDTAEIVETGDSDTGPVVCDRTLGWKAVEAGSALTCGIHTDGCAECWGRGKEEDTGGGSGWYRYVGEDEPPAGSYETIELVTVGGDYYGNPKGSCGLLTDASMVCWGWKSWVDPGPYIAMSVHHLGEYALTTAGGLVKWDEGGVPSEGTFTTLSVGDYDAMAIQEDGRIRRWDPGDEGVAEEETIDGAWVSASVGLGACAIDGAGEVTCWDDFWNVQPFSGDSNPPGPFTSICVTGDYTACALDPSGLPTCWGEWPDVVDGTPTGTSFTQISCGTAHVCGVTPAGEIVCWGTNDYGECEPPV